MNTQNSSSAFSSDATEHPVPDREIDACGLQCPLPILRARKALAELASGQHVKVLSTDAGSPNDFASFAAQTGNTLVAQGDNSDGVFWFLLRRR